MSAISAAYEYSPEILASLASPASPPVAGRLSVWSSCSSDLIRQFFTFLCSPSALYIASTVCRSWQRAIDHPAIFSALAQASGWAYRGKAAFQAQYKNTRIYNAAIPTQIFVEDKRAGIIALHACEPVLAHNWATGLVEAINQGLLVAATSAPLHQISIFDLDKASSGPAVPIREQRIPQPNAAAALAPVVDAPLRRFQWSAVEIHGDMLIFADSQAPQLYSYNWTTRQLKKFAAPHASAITFVKVGILPVALPSRPKFEKFQFLAPNHIENNRNKTKQTIQPEAIRQAPERSNLCVSCSYDTSVSVWDIESGAQLARLIGGNTQAVWCADIQTERMHVACAGDDRKIRIFQLTSPQGSKVSPAPGLTEFGGELLSVLVGHTRCPMVSKFDPFSGDSHLLYSAGYDHTIRQWNYLTGECQRVFETPNTVFALEILEYVIISSLRGNLLNIFDKENGESLRVLTLSALPNPAANSIYGLGMHATAGLASIDVRCLAVSADGLRITAANTAGGICQWKFTRSAINKMKSRLTGISPGPESTGAPQENECSIM